MKRLSGGIPEVKDFSPEDVVNVAGVSAAAGLARAAGGWSGVVARSPGMELGTFGGNIGFKNIVGQPMAKEVMSRIDELTKMGVSDKDVGRAVTSEYSNLKLGQILKREDGLWRFEIDDSEMLLAPALIEGVKTGKYTGAKFLSSMLQHPQLYKAYPELAGIEVHMSPSPSGFARGGYNNKDKRIHIQYDKVDDLKRTLIHEVQHYIQNVEGFSPGSNSKVGWIQEWVKNNQDKWRRELAEFEEKNKHSWTSISSVPEESQANLLRSMEMYRRVLGEQEAEMAASRINLDRSQRRIQPADADNPVVIHPDVDQFK
jgi:hypothetical protein